MRTPQMLLLSFAVSLAIAGCQKREPAEPAAPADATANAPAPAPAAELPPTAQFAVADLDTGKNVCDNLADFVNAKWLAAHPIPADRTTWGSFEMLTERS
ncbi:MAG TPA: peptidase, partial [Xanthomonadaceae bacterium]|nr:peptidase [Xanthomonadaceae bacterium]